MSFSANINDIVAENRNKLLGTRPHWKRIRLGDVATILNGYPFESSRFSKDDGTPLLRIRDIQRGQTETFYDGEYDPAFLVQPGDLVIGMDGDFNCALWKRQPSLLNQRVCKVAPDERQYSKRFLLYVLPGYLSAINEQTSSVTVKHLSSKTIADIPLPLPPIKEQLAIVDDWDKQFSRLDEAVASIKRAQANLKRYKASVLKAAVEGKLTEQWRKDHPDVEPASELLKRIIAERRQKWQGRGKYKEPAAPETSNLPPLPQGWVWVRWEQVGFSQNGRAFPSSEYAESGFRLLRPGNLHASGRVMWTTQNTRLMPRRWAEEYREFIVRPDELVMNLTAQSLKDEFLGRVCLTGPDDDCLLNQRIARLTPVTVQPRYLLLLFRSRLFRQFVNELNTGSLIQHMFTSQLADFALPLPPLPEQLQIVAEVERRLSVVEELEADLSANLHRTTRLRQAVLAAAFSSRNDFI